jgi:hypothetical protein
MLYEFCVWASDRGFMGVIAGAERSRGRGGEEDGGEGGVVLQCVLSKGALDRCAGAWHEMMEDLCSKAGTVQRQEAVGEALESVVETWCKSGRVTAGVTAGGDEMEEGEDEEGDAVMLGVVPRRGASDASIELLSRGSLTEDGVYRIQAGVVVGGEQRVAVELVGALQFLEKGNVMDGATMARHWGLMKRGWKVVAVRYWEWDEWTRGGDEVALLRDAIAEAMGSGE